MYTAWPSLRFPMGTQLLVKLLFRGQKLLGRHRYDDFIVERIGSVPILVTPSVFNPKRLRTGAFFASVLDGRIVSSQTTVLDMGTGSGICAVFAARHAERVVAVDVNPAAVRCARINALLNQVEQRIDARRGDLFDAVSGERFDLILFNPPFLRGTPLNDRERAWRSNDVAERFAADLREHLTPSGFALVLLSTFGASVRFLEELQRRDHDLSVFARCKYLGEQLTIFKVTHPASGART
ncbi:methyltransferase [Steroidobacter cummioxidans]|uniref:methyltransferase n=1 Tax=Steroidobacter cummioxidans TaxID=1803913 RepID=UPI000E321F15|nr:methyltransferase [Steroidobacter cummioxidans]